MKRAAAFWIVVGACLIGILWIWPQRSGEGFTAADEPLPYRIAVVSANFGGYDTIKEHRIRLAEKVDWYYFTDSDTIQSTQWNIIRRPYHQEAQPVHGVNSLQNGTLDDRTRNMMTAKYYKAQTHRIDILKDYDYYIWIDGSIRLRDSFLEEVCKLFDNGSELISFQHSKRSTLADELAESRKSVKYKTQNLEKQIADYRSAGYKDDLGLYENTIMIRKNTAKNAALFDEWWRHNVQYSYQDQLSFPYCAWKLKTRPDTVLQENVWSNKKFSYNQSADMKQHWV
jgi:Protein of unknown function (DUF616)